MVWLPLAVVRMVTDVPLAAVTSPATMARLAGPLGVGLGEGLGRGVAPAPGGGAKLALQPAAGLGARRTAVAVTAPLASLVPVATMQVPGVMSASVAVEVLVIGVVAEKVTVVSPFGPVMMSDW